SRLCPSFAQVTANRLRPDEPFDEGQRRVEVRPARRVEIVGDDRVIAFGQVGDLAGELAPAPLVDVADLAATLADERTEAVQGLTQLRVVTARIAQQHRLVRAHGLLRSQRSPANRGQEARRTGYRKRRD